MFPCGVSPHPVLKGLLTRDFTIRFIIISLRFMVLAFPIHEFIFSVIDETGTTQRCFRESGKGVPCKFWSRFPNSWTLCEFAFVPDYNIIPTPASWENAKMDCESIGKKLVTVPDLETNRRLKESCR